MPAFSPSEYQNRIKTIQNYLQKNNIDAAVLIHSSDLLYYCGSILPLYLIIPGKENAFILERKGGERIADEIPHIESEFFSGSKDLKSIWESRLLSDTASIGFALDTSSYTAVTRIQSLSPKAAVTDISSDLRFLRMIKSEKEIEIIRNAADILSEMPEIIRSRFKPGMTELELSAEIEHCFRLKKNGAINIRQEGLVMAPGVCSAGRNSLLGNKFDGICSGKGISGAMPFGAADEIIPENTPIIIDYGFVLDGYHADMTRMASIGNVSSAVMDAYNAMRTIEREIISAMKPGILWEDIYSMSLLLAEKFGYADEFMGLGKNKVRFVGHGVGIQLDEPPFIAPKMKFEFLENMTIAIEPKVALPGIGVVGIEDTVLIKKDSCEILTKASDDFIIL